MIRLYKTSILFSFIFLWLALFLGSFHKRDCHALSLSLGLYRGLLALLSLLATVLEFSSHSLNLG